MKKLLTKFLLILLITIIVIGVWVGIDLNSNSKIITTVAKDDFSKSLENPINDILIALEEGESPDYTHFSDVLTFIDHRYDTSDFRLPSLIRILMSHEDQLPDVLKSDIKTCLTGFKYWMDQPGDDSMCYWSENHQILFATAEYILGDFYEDDFFTNMNILGSQHRELGKQRVLDWLEQRYLYGFTEWYSSTYYVEDIAPLSILIDFAPDEEVRIKAAMILDLMIYDLATQNYKGTFTSNSGRMYASAKMSGKNGSMKESISVIWPDYNQYINVTDFKGMEANFKYIKNYQVPEVLINIGYDQTDTNVYMASTGLNISEYKGENLLGQKQNQIMFQLASEAFTNPSVINNTLKFLDENNMFSNEFLSDFKMINLGVLKTFNLTPLVSTIADPMFNGTAIQRANTYMYRTPNYAMSTAQAYHPGTYGDQHSLFSLTINNDFNIFNQQPAAALSENGALGSSPNYWVGNGFNPHTVQHENINMSIYILPEKVNPIGDMVGMARAIENYTHSFFPKQYMDEVMIDDNYAFARIDNTYVALIGKNTLAYKSFDNTEYDQDKDLTDVYDLIQEGRETYWITEVGTTDEYDSFEAFISTIKSNDIIYHKGILIYNDLELTYKGDFKMSGQTINLEYLRFDSKYAQTERKADTIQIEFNGQSLYLDFDGMTREIQN